MAARVVGSSSVSWSPARPRIISPSAQNVMPSPYAGLRPSCHQTVSTSPSMYLRNSQARRDLPIPAGPMTLTRRGRPSRLVAWNRSRSWRSSSSRPTNGASRPSARPTPPRWATTRTARQAGTGATLPLSVCSATGSKTMASPAARIVASPTSTVDGSATPCRRLAVLTMSPETIPWSWRPGSPLPRPSGRPPGARCRDRDRAPSRPGRRRPGRPARRRPRARWARPTAP